MKDLPSKSKIAKTVTLKELSIDHPYYCSEGNYYSNEARSRYDTFTDFYQEMGDSDVDMNLVFRWDIHKEDEKELYSAEIFIMHQRKGRFWPIKIDLITEEDVPKFIEYITKHWNLLKKLWKPIS